VALGSRALATRRVYLFHYLPLSFLWGRRSSTDADDESTMDWSFFRKPLLVGGKGGEHRPSLLGFRWRQDAGLAYPHQDHNIDVQNSVVTNLCKIHKNHKYRSKFDFQICDGRIRYDPNLSILSINQSILPVYRYQNAKTSKGCLA
jgi:hypothetical protein